MNFIFDYDYHRVIRGDMLDDILDDELGHRRAGEDSAIAEVRQHLSRGRYDLEAIFQPVLTWDRNLNYPAGQQVAFEPPQVDPLQAYLAGDFVLADPGRGYHVYKCLGPATGQDINDPALFEKQRPFSPFLVAVDDVPPMTAPDDTTYWKVWDNRHPLLVMYLCDIAIYHILPRLDGRQIPEIRIKRYQEAKSWLKNISQGRITDPGLPQTEEPRTGSITFFTGKHARPTDV